MKLKSEIVKELEDKFGKEYVYVVSTEGYDLRTNPKGRNSKKDRSRWADSIINLLHPGVDRRNITSDEYNFSYIKFGINDKGEVYGLVSGKSSFHCMYPGDVWFYEFDGTSKKEIEKCMSENHMVWYENEVLILKNNDVFDSEKAYENEGKMKEMFSLFD